MLRLFSSGATLVIATCPVLIRRAKSFFTIRVDQMFTASREPAFTNATDHPTENPVIA
jgi:hypothetical protein